jgi:RNA polymerase sigma-54 factor
MKIKELVDNEDPKKPLSDQKVADILKQSDIVVARRTIAKYREMLNILPSSKRKVRD